jgi:hypothetical protein
MRRHGVNTPGHLTWGLIWVAGYGAALHWHHPLLAVLCACLLMLQLIAWLVLSFVVGQTELRQQAMVKQQLLEQPLTQAELNRRLEELYRDGW